MSERNDLSITVNQYGTCWIWSITKRVGHKPIVCSAHAGEYAAFATPAAAFTDALRVLATFAHH